MTSSDRSDVAPPPQDPWHSGILRWADRLQQRMPVLGFPVAVFKKYGEDAGRRHAALFTYYMFISVFPLLLLAVAIVQRLLQNDPALTARLINEIVPIALQPTVTTALATLPSSGVAFTIGLVGLLLSSLGVVTSAYNTLNHLAAVPHRLRFTMVHRYLRIVFVLIILLLGMVAIAGFAVLSQDFLDIDGLQRTASLLGAVLVMFVILQTAAWLLVSRPTPISSTWPAALVGSMVITAVLIFGGTVLARLVVRSGAVYGSFATIVGIFTLLLLTSQALVFTAEIATVHRGHLWPRSLDPQQPIAADFKALRLLAREQERLPRQRNEVRLIAGDASAHTTEKTP